MLTLPIPSSIDKKTKIQKKNKTKTDLAKVPVGEGAETRLTQLLGSVLSTVHAEMRCSYYR